jgi:hypothetical protein
MSSMMSPDTAWVTDMGAASGLPESGGASMDSESSGPSVAPEEEVLEPDEDDEDEEEEVDVETASKPPLASSTNPPSSPFTSATGGCEGVVEQLAAQTVAKEAARPEAVHPRQLGVPRIAEDSLRAVTSRMQRYYRREWVRAVQLAAGVEVQR